MNDATEGNSLQQPKLEWLAEIIRDTEHFCQAEAQQDQRGSWMLASVAVLIVAWASLEIVIIENGYSVPQPLMTLALFGFLLSGLATLVNFIPLRGVKYLTDLFGRKYRNQSRLKTDELIERRFRQDTVWSRESLEMRIMYHYRIHYLRNLRKAYGVLWSSVLLVLGLIAFTIALVSLPLEI